MKKRRPANTPKSLSNKKSKHPSARPVSRLRSNGLQYQSLEQRLPLDASFAFDGGVLTISNFTEETELTVNAGGDVVATISGGEWVGMNPGVAVNDDGDQITVMEVAELVVSSSGFTAPLTSVVLNVQGGETLDNVTIGVKGDIQINTNGQAFDLSSTELITDGNITQRDNRPGVSTVVDLGELSFRSGGNASFDSLGATSLGGEVGGNLSIFSEVGELLFKDQFGLDFDNDGSQLPDGLFVAGDATITVAEGSIGQSADSPVIVRGELNISTSSDGFTSVNFSGSSNNFNQVNIESRSRFFNNDIRVFDTDSFTVDNARGSEIVHLAAGRGDIDKSIRSSTFDGSLTLSGAIASNNLILQASEGVSQLEGSEIQVSLLMLGGEEISEGRGDFIFNGVVDSPLSGGNLVGFDIAAKVRGNLDLDTNSELTMVSETLTYTDGRVDETYDTSWVDGNTRIDANALEFDVDFTTTKFVLSVEADVTQSVDTALTTDQLYISGKRIDLGNDTNNTGQIAARGIGDESFIRFHDLDTFRVVTLDGEIEGNSADRPVPATLSGLSTDRIPDIGIGDRSFIELSTGFDGPSDNPRLGMPDIELDDIETFSVIREDNLAVYETEEFGEDGRGVYFVEFIYDGVSPFEFIAQGEPFDAELALYDEDGDLLFTSDDPSLDLNSSISDSDFIEGLEAGRYYLASAAFSATFGDNFDVQTEFDDGVPALPLGTLLITLESDIGDPDEPYEELLARLESFIAPEVRRSFFQDDDAAINTEKLTLTAFEDGSIVLVSPQNLIDELCIIETNNLILNSSTTIDIDQLNAAGDVSLTAVEDINVSNVIAQGDMSIVTMANIFGENLNAGGSFDLEAVTNIVIDGLESGADVALDAGGSIMMTSFDVAGNIVATSAGDDVVVDGVRAQGDVSLSAADDIRLAMPTGIQRLEAANLLLNAGNNTTDGINGIFLFTDVDTIAADVGRGGQIFVNERSDIDVGNLTTFNGPISLRAGGSLTGANVSVARPGDDITLIARGDGADISVDSVTVLGSNDTVRLFADDDITANVRAGNLRAQAKNLLGDQNVSVKLNTTVRSLNVDAGLLANENPNRGDIVVNESDPLTLSRAVAANGKILVSANGNLITGNVQSNGISTDNAIELRAIGIGSDLLTSRIVVRDGTGGVLLSADDDIVDGNVNDRLAVVADSVTFTAGSNLNDSFNGIIGHTYVKSLSANVTSNADAGAFLFNNGNITVRNSAITNGRFSLINRSGVVQVDDISILSQQLDNRVFVKTSGIGADILVGRIEVGENGIVTLDSADDVLDTDLLDDLFISGEFLNVTARNSKSDSYDGILLNIDVDEFADVALNGGQSFVRRQS